MMRTTKVLAVAGAGMLTVLLAACGSTEAGDYPKEDYEIAMATPGDTGQREAAEASASPATDASAETPAATAATGAATPGATAPAAPDGDKVGRALGSHVCIENVTTSSLNVEFTKYDTRESAVALAPGAKSCAEGTFAASSDVRGRITVASGRQIAFRAWNPSIGYPQFDIWEVEDDETGVCTTYSAGDSNTFDNAENTFKITRHEDAGWKMFTVRVGGGRQLQSKGCARGHGARL